MTNEPLAEPVDEGNDQQAAAGNVAEPVVEEDLVDVASDPDDSGEPVESAAPDGPGPHNENPSDEDGA